MEGRAAALYIYKYLLILHMSQYELIGTVLFSYWVFESFHSWVSDSRLCVCISVFSAVV